MSEVEKMYENAEIKSVGFNPYKLEDEYPPFTAEKILKIIIFLLNKQVKLSFSVEESTKISVENFKECIAKSVNYLWQDLTEEEKEVLRGILRA